MNGDGGARRILAAQGAVEQQVVRRCSAGRGLLVDGDEKIGIVARHAGEGQHVAVAWIDGDDGATARVSTCCRLVERE